MKRDGSKAVASNQEEAQAAQQDLPSARSSLVPLRLASAHDVPSNFAIEALLRQALEGDQDARAGVEQCLGETVRQWLYGHLSKGAVCCWESEDHYLTQAFERFWQVIADGQLRDFASLSTALRYLQASLNSVLLDSLRAHARPRGIALQGLLTREKDQEKTKQIIANCGSSYNVCSLMFVSGGWPTCSFIV